MDIKEQLVSKDIAREMNEIGIAQNSLFYWWRSQTGWTILYNPGTLYRNEGYSAFTFAELDEMLPEGYNTTFFLNDKNKKEWDTYKNRQYQTNPTVKADARAKMVIYQEKEKR